MKTRGFYAYIRTSTVKQGTEGVSLEVQRDQAERLARQKGVEISKVFSEMETAAKQGRPVFTQMIKELRAGAAEGLILHKIDRGARNLREWSDITDLIELGKPVLFVQDSSLNLATRGGRLQGDIQAVIAADYIRNLREETMKGIVGRLKQGLWPFGAPLGYINNGKGKPKTIDPVKGPLVRKAFELYATGSYTLHSLRKKLHELGLRTPQGRPLAKNAFTVIFNNTFYVGLMKLRSTGEMYSGIHTALVSQTLFNQVQVVLQGRYRRRPGKHDHLYRGDIVCAACSYKLTGETQKGHVYYRCHSKQCAGTSVREELASVALANDLLSLLRFMEACPELEEKLHAAIASEQLVQAKAIHELRLQHAKLEQRLNAATDALLDGAIDRDTFVAKKNAILQARLENEEAIEKLERGETLPGGSARLYFELLKTLRTKVFLTSPRHARDSVRLVTSNFLVSGKTVAMQWEYRFDAVIEHAKQSHCAHPRDRARTIAHFTKILMGEQNVPTSPSLARSLCQNKRVSSDKAARKQRSCNTSRNGRRTSAGS